MSRFEDKYWEITVALLALFFGLFLGWRIASAAQHQRVDELRATVVTLQGECRP